MGVLVSMSMFPRLAPLWGLTILSHLQAGMGWFDNLRFLGDPLTASWDPWAGCWVIIW